MCSTYDFVCMLQDINWVSVIHVMFCVGWTWHGKGSGAVPWRKIRGLCMIMPRNSSAWNRCFGSQAWRNVLWNQTQPIPKAEEWYHGCNTSMFTCKSHHWTSESCSFHTIIVHHTAYISPSYPHYVGWMNQHLCRMNHVFCKPSWLMVLNLADKRSNTILGLKSLGSIHFKNLTRLKQTLISMWCSRSKSSGKNI